jgi:hypothetical protein
VSSALACLGLAASDGDEFNVLLKHALTGTREIGTFGGVYVGRWQDDSGAILTLGLHDGQIEDFTFAYAGTSGALFVNCRPIYQSIAWAQVTDEAGQQVTAIAFEAEQYRQLAAHRHWVSGLARITALGLDVAIYPDPEAFAASPASQVHLAAGIASPPPPDWDGPWPPRLAAESFTSYAGVADRPHLQSRAWLSCTVLDATRRVSELTGQAFTVAAVRTAGFEASLCLAVSDHPELPAPGSIISGTVVLSAAIDTPILNGEPA